MVLDGDVPRRARPAPARRAGRRRGGRRRHPRRPGLGLRAPSAVIASRPFTRAPSRSLTRDHRRVLLRVPGGDEARCCGLRAASSCRPASLTSVPSRWPRCVRRARASPTGRPAPGGERGTPIDREGDQPAGRHVDGAGADPGAVHRRATAPRCAGRARRPRPPRASPSRPWARRSTSGACSSARSSTRSSGARVAPDAQGVVGGVRRGRRARARSTARAGSGRSMSRRTSCCTTA